MVHTLQSVFDWDELAGVIATQPMRWQFRNEEGSNVAGHYLICGNYIIALIWNLGTTYQTWRTAWCGAHNTETNLARAKRYCEKVVADQLTKQKEDNAVS